MHGGVFRRGWSSLHLVGDNQSSLWQTLRLRASDIAYMALKSGLTVHLHWVRSELMPVDPISRYLEGFGGSMVGACLKAREISNELRTFYNETAYVGKLGDFVFMLQNEEVGATD